MGADHESDYDLKYNEENKDGLMFTLDCRGVVEKAIATALPTGFSFHTFIEMSIDENELVGQIVLKCTEYYIILDSDDATRRALVFALEKADTAVIRNVGSKVVIDINVSLKKYLTN